MKKIIGSVLVAVAFAGVVGVVSSPAAADDRPDIPDASMAAIGSDGSIISSLPQDDAPVLDPLSASTGSGALGDLGTEGTDWSAVDPTVVDLGTINSGGSLLSPMSVIGSDSRRQFTIPGGQLGNSTWLLLEGADGTTISRCSGGLIQNNYVLTAAHCVFNYNAHAWYPYIRAFVGYTNNGTGVLCSMTQAYAGANYIIDGDPSADWGLIKLSCDANSVFGSYAITTDYNFPNESIPQVEVCGYPGDKPEGTLWCANGFITGSSATRVSHNVDTEAGESGAPLINATNSSSFYAEIVGIHTLGVPNSQSLTENAGVRITQPLRTAIINTVT